MVKVGKAQIVHLVYGRGAKDFRVRTVELKGGVVDNIHVMRHLAPGEHFLGAIGHAGKKLAPERARKILMSRAPMTSVFVSPGVIVPAMIDVPGQSYRIMKYQIRVGEIKGFYLDAEPESGEIIFQLSGVNPKKVMTCVTLWDALDYAFWLTKQTGLNFRVPTKVEWQKARRLLGNKMRGKSDLKEWTATNDYLLGDQNCFYVVKLKEGENKDYLPSFLFDHVDDTITFRLIQDI